MKRKRSSTGSLCKDERAVSPAISTVILTGAIVALLLVTIVFANNFLEARMAENEFTAMEQFMQTVELQLDDVAWTIGRTQTIRYTSRYGQVSFQNATLKYSVYVDNGSGWTLLLTNETGIILFNMPISKFSMSNNYFKRMFPSSDGSFLQPGTSAPTAHVFTVEKLPMNDGSYIRVVAAPSIRTMNSSIQIQSQAKNYFKFYLPFLVTGKNLYRSQSITVTGKEVTRIIENEVTSVRINVTFPKASLGFDSSFFNFESTTEIYDVPDGAIIEFYIGKVEVSLGLHA